MADPAHESDPQFEPRVSQAIARDLGALFNPDGLHVPPAMNQRILNQARARIIGRSRRRPLLRWAGAAAAAAAVVVLVVRLNLTAPPSVTLHAASVPADVDGNGRVDILDALALARRVESNHPDARDVTGDGATDARDVDAVAMRAVALRNGGVR